MSRSAITVQHQDKLSAAMVIDRLNISAGMIVAEIGAGGSGHVAIPVARKVGDVGAVYAVEVQPKLLEILEKRALDYNLHNIEYVRGNVERMMGSRIANGDCDRVLFINSMHQMEDKETALQEASRILADDGTILIVDWGTKLGCPYPLLRPYCFDPEQITEAIADANLVHIDTFYVKPYYWGMLLGKSNTKK